MKYKITEMPNPNEFIKNGYIMIHPWIPNGKYCIKMAPMENGFGECVSFSVEVVDTWKINVNNKIITFANICFDIDQYEQDTNRILIIDDRIWLEAIEGGLKWFRIEEVSE